MATLKNCELPGDLYYNVDSNVWARREADGSVTVGMTAYACALAGEAVACTPKKIGRTVELNRPVATIESGKWVGPLRAPVSGEVVAVNASVVEDPSLLNADPYGEGWVVRIRPWHWDAESGALLTGSAAIAAFEEKMAAEGFAGCP